MSYYREVYGWLIVGLSVLALAGCGGLRLKNCRPYAYVDYETACTTCPDGDYIYGVCIVPKNAFQSGAHGEKRFSPYTEDEYRGSDPR